MPITRIYFGFIASVCLVACSNTVDDFKETSSGKALYQCVAGSGDLNVKPIELNEGAKGVDVTLKKSKTINMQFSVNKSLNQASLVGASIEGEENLSKFVLMLNLEMACGGSLSSQILPDEYNVLKMMP